MKALHPTIDEILAQFFAEQFDGKRGLAVRRIAEVERRLRVCCERESDRILTDAERAVLAIERQFNPDGAVARIMHADPLIFFLSIFVKPEWLPPDPVQAKVQLRIVERLAGFLLRQGLIDRYSFSCPLIDIEIRIRRGRDEARQQRARR
jgi:hypothetical protein